MNTANQGGELVPANEQSQLPARRADKAVLDVKDMVKRQDMITQAMGQVMKQGVHYGEIQGVNGKMLLKPGADMLLSMFRIAAIPKVIDLAVPGDDEVHIRVMCEGMSQVTGQIVGVGVGECSTYEKKYRWKKCGDKEWENTPVSDRTIEYYGNRETKKVRQMPGDLSNTILKMAKKRAQADLVLTVLGASAMFADGEPDSGGGQQQRNNQGAKQAPAQSYQEPPPPQAEPEPRPEHKPDDPIHEGMLGMLNNKMEACNVKAEDVCAAFNVMSLTELLQNQINDVFNWIRENAGERTEP